MSVDFTTELTEVGTATMSQDLMSNSTGYVEEFDPYFPDGTFLHPHWRQYIPMMRDLNPLVYYAIGLYMMVVGIVGTLGNMVVIYLFIKTKSLRTPPNMFIVNLALSDMGFCATNGFPMMTVACFNKIWNWGPIGCEIYALAGSVTGLNSIFTLGLISVDRYMVIAKPFYAMKHVSHKRSLIQCIISWIWACTWSFPPLLRLGYGRYIPEGLQVGCTFDYLSRDLKNTIFVAGLFILGFFIPVCIIAVSYLGIMRAVSSQAQEMRKTAEKMGAKTTKSDKEKKQDIAMAKIAACTIGLFLMSWIPYASVAAMGILGMRQYIDPFVSQGPVMFAKASAMWNPILYALSHPKFRAALEDNLPWLLVCKGRNTDRDDEKSDAPKKVAKKPARQDSVMSAQSVETDIEMTSVAGGDVSTICDKTQPMDANNSNSTHLPPADKISLQNEIANKTPEATQTPAQKKPSLKARDAGKAKTEPEQVHTSPNDESKAKTGAEPVPSSPKKITENGVNSQPEENGKIAEEGKSELGEESSVTNAEDASKEQEEAKKKLNRRLGMRHVAKAYSGFKEGMEKRRKRGERKEEEREMESGQVMDRSASQRSDASGAERSWDPHQSGGIENPTFAKEEDAGKEAAGETPKETSFSEPSTEQPPIEQQRPAQEDIQPPCSVKTMPGPQYSHDYEPGCV